MNLGPYAKSVTAAVVAGFTAAISALADGNVTAIEWTVIAGAFLVALGGVFAVPNYPDSARAYSKAILSGLIALAASLGVALTDGGVSSAELLTMGIALLSGLGLTATVPNAEQSDGPADQPEPVAVPLDEDDDTRNYPEDGNEALLPDPER